MVSRYNKVFVTSVLASAISLVSANALAAPATGLSSYKIDSTKTAQYSNTYQANDSLPGVTAYLGNWTHYQQGYQPDLNELAKYETVLLSFFGLCGTEIGDPTVTGGVNALKTSCAKYGLKKFELSTTDDYADLEKQFPGMGMVWQPDLAWLSPNPNGLLGVMKKLHEEKGTRIGISVFGWSLSNIASDAVKPANRPVFLNSLITFVKAYPFIGQLDIDWEYPGIQGAEQNVFDPANDARNYKEFIGELRTALDNMGRHDVRIGIASGAPQDKIDAAKLNDLVAAGVNDIHLMTYDFFGQWDSTLNHQTNLFSSDETKWSADRAIQYMINDLSIPSENIRLGYANYSRNALVKGDIEQYSPLKGDFTPQSNTAGTFEAAVTSINDFIANFVTVSEDEPMRGKDGYEIYTDAVSNADYAYNSDNKLFVSIDTPRSVYAKAQYVKKYKLGGIFTWMADHDEGLMLNAAREGLGYTVANEVFDMDKLVNSCGINITSAEECKALTQLHDSAVDAEAKLTVKSQVAAFELGKVYPLTAELSGADAKDIKKVQWKLLSSTGAAKKNFVIDNKDGAANALEASFTSILTKAPNAAVKMNFEVTVLLKDGTELVKPMAYSLEKKEIVPVINGITASKQYKYADIATGKEFAFSARATGGKLAYQWNVTPATVKVVAGTEASKQLLIDTTSLVNRPEAEVTATLVVTNQHDNSATASATTVVIGDKSINAAPTVDMDVVSEAPKAGDIVEMQSTATDELIDELTYTWTATRDGAEIVVDQAKGQLASFSPKDAGEYVITVAVTDVFGKTGSDTQTITVAERPEGDTCAPVDPEAANHPAWDAATVYNTGDTVSMNSLVYSANWWTQGNEPSPTAAEWMLMSEIELSWSAEGVYNTGDQVDFEGKRWEAKWWNQGNQPGQDGVWMEVGAAKCD